MEVDMDDVGFDCYSILNPFEFWDPILKEMDGIETSDSMPLWIFPAKDQWSIPNLYGLKNGETSALPFLELKSLSPAQCEVVAHHLSDLLFWEQLKVAGVAAGAFFLTVAVATVALSLAMLVTSLAISIITAAFAAHVAAGIATAVLLSAVGVWSMLHALHGFLAFGLFMVNKAALPNIMRGVEFILHRNDQIRKLEFRSASKYLMPQLVRMEEKSVSQEKKD